LEARARLFGGWIRGGISCGAVWRPG